MTEQQSGQQQPAPQQSGNKTSTGLQENVAGLLCYLAWWVTGIIFLLIEKENKVVRFHAIQSIIVFGVFTILSAIFSWWRLFWIIDLIAAILWIVLMVQAYQGKKVKMPWAGNFAEKKA
ncbi:MAG: hypothetical protein JW967_05270 [Dehalococcoidales bacterium]|nr:hypothetical protein [Dehalococcoidales bacterium]